MVRGVMVRLNIKKFYIYIYIYIYMYMCVCASCSMVVTSVILLTNYVDPWTVLM